MLVVREVGSGPGIEVFCVLRHQKSSFLGGAVVFPGGKVDPADGADAWAGLTTEPHPRVAQMADDDGVTPRAADPRPPPSPTPRALAVAACRETLEEGGIIPLAPALFEPPFDADRPGPDPAVVDALRLEAASAEGGLAAALARCRLRLALDRLVPWARWITPEAEGRRFDARFFLLELPPGQVGRHDEHETTMSFWARPGAILERAARGEIFLAPPTTRSLELLAHARDVGAALALASEQSLRPICPLFVPDDVSTMGAVPPDPRSPPSTSPRAPFLALPGDPAHAERERRVAGPTRFVLRDGRFVSEDPAAPSPPSPAAGHGAAPSAGTEGGRAM